MSLLDGKAIRDWCKKTFIKCEDMIKSKEEIESNQEEGKSVDALVIKEVFQSVSNGKSLIASAITDKGVETDADSTFEIMAQNIINIPSGSGGNVTIKVSTVSASQTDYPYKANNILLKNLFPNYQKLKFGESIFFSLNSIYRRASLTINGWRGNLYGTPSYNPETGILSIPSVSDMGYSGTVYVIEIE